MNSSMLAQAQSDINFGTAGRFTHPVTGMRLAKVFPGEMFGTSTETYIVTVLGSCVSACIRDPHAGIGGMNHFMLPAGKSTEMDPTGDHRYGLSAMNCLIANLVAHGARHENLEVKLFGGGNMLDRDNAHRIGDENIAFVTQYMKDNDLRIASSDLGKRCPRKIIFNHLDGSVQMKRLEPMYRAVVAKHDKGASQLS